jgi:deoxycytidylate deaminase
VIDWLPYATYTENSEDRKWLFQAYCNALSSKDESTQNGSLLLAIDGQIVSGYNDFPPNVNRTEERLKRPLKYEITVHAEKWPIYLAAKYGITTKDATLYCNWYACPTCAQAIIMAGVKRVVGHLPMYLHTPDRWRQPVIIGFEMLHEAGVKCDIYTKDFGKNIPIRFNGITMMV